MSDIPRLRHRFRGYLPVIIDVETGGFNSATDALLEVAAVTVRMDEDGTLWPDQIAHHHVEPFEGANIEKAALEFTGIDPYHPFRMSVTEEEALEDIFKMVRRSIKEANCTRAILVGHNAFFDQGFINAAVKRADIKRNPFHPFSCFDTATLSGLAYGQTVLAKACEQAGIEFSVKDAHSAVYDATKTAELFCKIVNAWKDLGGWPLP
ncbi:MAG TPA: ribonuclease T [Pseudomonadales bacterium]|nr:ribonuclease T [Pseudomonadales bacterium]